MTEQVGIELGILVIENILEILTGLKRGEIGLDDSIKNLEEAIKIMKVAQNKDFMTDKEKGESKSIK